MSTAAIIVMFAGVFLGGVTIHLMGWANSNEKYSARKTFATVLSIIIGTGGLSMGIIGGGINANTYGLATLFVMSFGTGAGMNGLGQGIVKLPATVDTKVAAYKLKRATAKANKVK